MLVRAARTAGTSVAAVATTTAARLTRPIVVTVSGGVAVLPSSPSPGLASVGAVSNPDNQNIVIGKAGRQRWLGRRPVVRGVAMNPVDHPHGGGEGKTSGGRHPVTPWGKPTKGKKTRKNKATDKYIIRHRQATR